MISRNRANRRRTRRASQAGPQIRRQTLFSLAIEFCSGHSTTLQVAGLVGILFLSFWSGMNLHWDYPYPLHVDEWFGIGFAQGTLDSGALEYPNPYKQGQIVSYHPEMGFHLLLGFLKTATGLSWLGLYRIAPGVLVAGLAFLTFAFGRKSGFGWAAALFVPLIPTSVRILGPAFVVPVSAAMLFIPVTLLVLHNMDENNWKNSVLKLALLVTGAIIFHPPTGVVVTGLVGLYLMGFTWEYQGTKRYDVVARRFLHGLLLTLIPAVILWLWLPSFSKDALVQLDISGSDSVPTLGLITGFTGAFGIFGVIVFVLGLFVFIARHEFGVRSHMLTIFTGLLLAFLVFIFPVFGIGPDVLYRRGWLYLGLLMAIFAGYGVSVYFRAIPKIVQIAGSRFQGATSTWATITLWVFGAAALGFVLTGGLFGNESRRSYSTTYNVVNEEVFTDFRWIGEHSTPGQRVAMGESTIAWAYPPVAGPGTTSLEAVFSPFTNQRAERLRQMLSDGQADVPWLRESGVSIFYSCLPISFVCREMTNIDMFKVGHGVYLIPDIPEQR